MADAIVRLRVESSEYDQKLGRATQQLQYMEKEVRRTGATFAYADKEKLAFVQSLGSMETKSTSARQKLREYTEAITSMTATYRKMTEEERQSPFGKAMSASIDQLKAKASELQDIMSDTQREIQNLASDTSFTDGISLMTRTIGSCAAAITAWTGDSKEMEAVIKDLAKIGATVAAVDSLTKAFQKQNLVLLKNPYVAAAAGAVALAVAFGKLYKSMHEVSAAEKDVADAQAKGREDAAKEITRIDTLNNILHDNTRSLDERKAALAEIQSLVPNYHGALTTEGNLINDNTDALADYVSELQRAATAQAAFDRMVEINKQKLAKQVELKGAQERSNVASANYEQFLSSSYTGNTGSSGVGGGAVGSQLATEAVVARKAVSDIQDAIDEYDEELKELQSLINGADLQTGGGVAKTAKGSTTNTSTGSGYKLSSPYGMPAAGSLADLERQAAMVQASMKNATTPEEYKEMENYLDSIIAKMKELKGETDIAFAPGSLNDLNEQLRDAQDTLANCVPFTKEWADALADVAAKQAAVNELQSQINASTTAGADGAKETGDEWRNAVSAVGQLGGALQSIEDPAAKVAGIIAQAIANIALTFATSLKGSVGPWDWIAAAIAGTATMISTITAIKSATAGSYAEGGIIPGNSFSGDRLTANVNSGELILNRAQQNNIAGQLQNNNQQGGGAYSSFVTGENIVLGVNNFLGRSGHGEIVTTSMLRRAGIKL